MAKNLILNPGWLLKTSGLGAMAAALAMMAMPVDAFAQHGRGGGWNGGGGHSAQSQSGGGWSGGRSWGGGNRGGGQSAQSQSGGGRSWGGNRGGGQSAQSQSNGGGGRSWSGNRGGGSGSVRSWRGNGGDGNGGSWRSRSGQSSGQWANPGQGGSGQRWRNRDNGSNAGTDNSAARAARMAEIERRRNAGTQTWSNQQQWSGRNRSYSNPDRNRNSRQGWRDGQRSDSWRDGNRNRWRDNNRNNDWRNNNWRNDSGRWNNNRWANGNFRRWDRNWRRDNRYDWHGYRNHNRHIFRLGHYYAPYRNHFYSRIGIGFYLDSLFFGSRYWIDDPWYYRLPPADGPYRWIRYYDDALLVDTYTGEVIDVIYDFFE